MTKECGIGQLVAMLFGGAMIPWEISNDTNPKPLNQAFILQVATIHPRQIHAPINRGHIASFKRPQNITTHVFSHFPLSHQSSIFQRVRIEFLKPEQFHHQ